MVRFCECCSVVHYQCMYVLLRGNGESLIISKIVDKVLTQNSKTKKQDFKPKTDSHMWKESQFYEIHVSKKFIETTALHPFWVNNEDGWVLAEDLLVGDVPVSEDSKQFEIDDTLIKVKTVYVYNITVADYKS